MIVNKIRNMRLAPKLMLSFLLLILIMAVFFLYLYSAAMNGMENMAVSASSGVHQQIQDKVEQRLSEFQNLTAYCQSDQSFVYLMNRERLIDGETVYQMDRQKKSLPNISISNSEIFGYYFYSALNGYAFSNAQLSMRIGLYYDQLFALEGVDYQGWKALMETPHTDVILLKAQMIRWDSAREACIPCLVPVMNSNLKYVGCGVFFLRESAISNLFGSQTGQKIAYACLKDAEGSLITEIGNKDVLNSPPSEILVMETRSDLGFECVSVIQKRDLSNELQSVRRLLTGGIIALLTLSLLLSALMTRQNADQIKAVLKRVEQMGYPVDRENEIRQLDGVIKMQYSANERYARQLQEKNEWAQSVLFERLLDGRETDARILAEMEQRLPCEETACVYLDLTAENGDALYAARQALEQRLREEKEEFPFWRSLSETRYQAVWRGKDGALCEKRLQELTEQAENNQLVGYIGPMVNSYKELPASSRNAQYRMMLQDPDGEKNVIICEKYPESDGEMIYTLEMDKQFTLSCLKGNLEEADRLLEKIRRESGRNGIASRMTTQLLISSLSKTILTVLGKLPGRFGEAEWVMNGIEEIQRRQSLENMISFAQKCAALFCAHAQSSQNTHAAAKLEEIENYLRENFSDPDMRLGKVAEQFGMDERYLSEFYKRNTGVNLSAHIEELRTAKGRELLRGGLSVSDTAFRAGYDNVNTFRRAYRRQYGINPSDETQDESKEGKNP